MRSSLLLLFAGFVLVLMAAGEADAEREPIWSYTAGNSVRSVSISADGEYIAAGSDDNNVYLFDKDSSMPLWSYTAGNSVRSVSISADGEYIAAGSDDNNVYLFGKDSNTPLWSYGTEGRVYSVAISADGEYIVAGSWDNKVYLFDKDSSTPLWNYTAGNSVRSVSISADGEYIAAGSDDNKVYLFGKDSSTPLWSSYSPSDYVTEIAISADGEYIIAGSWDNKVYLFGKDSSTPLWSYDIDNYITSLSISADGEYIAAGGGDSYLFHKDSSTPIRNYPIEGEIAISANGKYIAGKGGRVLYLFDRNSSTPIWSSNSTGNSTHNVESVAISADGEYIVVGFNNCYRCDATIYLFFNNIPPTATINSITPSPARFDAEVAFSGSGSDSDGTVIAYEWSCYTDGFLSDEADFSITGFSVGMHSISLRVQDNDGQWSEWDVFVLEIYPNTPPIGTIDSIEPSPAERGDEVTFNGTGSDTDGTIVVYQWESSIDGELSTDEDFSNNNLSLGQHTITFRVQDNDGTSNTVNRELWIYASPVAIAGQDSTGTPGVPLQFSGAGTDEDGTITKYEWDFDGDGVFEWSSTENGRELNIYNNEGTYTATLRVTDNEGFTGTDTVEITISEKKIQIDDGGNVTVTDAEEDEEGIPTLSMITTMAAVAVMALRRRPE